MSTPRLRKVRYSEWISATQLAVGDWVAEPSSGQPGRVSSVEIVGEFLQVEFSIGPPGRIGYKCHVSRPVCRLSHRGGKKAVRENAKVAGDRSR